MAFCARHKLKHDPLSAYETLMIAVLIGHSFPRLHVALHIIVFKSNKFICCFSSNSLETDEHILLRSGTAVGCPMPRTKISYRFLCTLNNAHTGGVFVMYILNVILHRIEPMRFYRPGYPIRFQDFGVRMSDVG